MAIREELPWRGDGFGVQAVNAGRNDKVGRTEARGPSDPTRGRSNSRTLTWAAVLNYRGSARGLRFTVSFRIGAVFPGGRKMAGFLATVPRFA